MKLTKIRAFAAVSCLALIPISAAPVFAADSTMPPPAMGSMPSGSVTASDKMFFQKAAIGGMTEIEAGKLAVSQGSSDDVKSFGQKMVDDHTKAADELKQLAASKNVTLPSAPDAKHQAMLDALKGKQGAAFDTAFKTDMKMGHAEAIKAFSMASKSKDTDVASYASKTLPTLKDHAKMLSTMSKTAGNMPANGLSAS